MKIECSIEVNGVLHTKLIESDLTLADFIRNELNLTGTKKGCESGHCGACTVLFDGRAVNSCMMLAIQAENHSIRTIEGLAEGEHLHPIQQAFIESNAIQCGFCSPGMILATQDLLDSNPNPTRNEAKIGLSGNLCRCTGYTKILSAVDRSKELLNEK